MLIERMIFINNLNINNFKFEKKNNNYLYIIEIKNNIYYLKRILNNNEIIIIKILNNQVEFNSIRSKKNPNLSNAEKYIIINDIISTLNCKTLVDFIDFEKMYELVKNSINNLVISNDLIGLAMINNNLFNIILLKTNIVIGYIRIDYDVKINVEKLYLKDSLNLLSDYINSKKSLKLVKN